jgi:hypothetical protein
MRESASLKIGRAPTTRAGAHSLSTPSALIAGNEPAAFFRMRELGLSLAQDSHSWLSAFELLKSNY